jgi:hypothetical protein
MGEAAQMELSPQTVKPVAEATVAPTVAEDALQDAVRGGEIVLPQEAKEQAPLQKIDLTQTAPARAFKLDQTAIQIIRELKCPGATDIECAEFLYQCFALGLNPLLPGQIHFAAYDGDEDESGRKERKRITMIGIEGLRLLALRTARYRQGDPPTITWGKDGWPEKVKVSLYENVSGKWVRHEAERLWSEFKYLHGRRMWKKNPSAMFPKAAEADLIRRYFADAVGGIYVPEEIDAPTMPILIGPKQAPNDIARDLLSRASSHYKRLGEPHPRRAAVDLVKRAVPDKAGPAEWTEMDVDLAREAVENLLKLTALPREPGVEDPTSPGPGAA